MKRLLFFYLFTLFTAASYAQLSVDSNGWTHARSINVSQSQSSSNGNPYGITSELIGITGATTCAVAGYNRGNTSVGLNTAIGVYGYAAETFGLNYGIYGSAPYMVPGTRGAGIYGTSSDYYRNLDDLFAGYFDGNVKILENLIVNGYITSSLLSNSLPGASSSRGLLFQEKLSTGITNQLLTLQTGTFYVEDPVVEPIIGDASSLRNLAAGPTDTLSVIRDKREYAASGRKHYGLSADQLEEVFPDLVYEQEDGTKSINYVEMVPILVQAINELNAKIETLENKDGDANKKTAQPATDKGDSEEKLLLLSLGQNKPNPFSNSTTIEVCIPEDVQKAFIYVYDLQGKKVEQIDVAARGKQNVQFTSANLTDGMYLYSLIADGKVVETRRMIVER